MIIAIACTSKQRRKKPVKKVEERRGAETKAKRKENTHEREWQMHRKKFAKNKDKLNRNINKKDEKQL